LGARELRIRPLAGLPEIGEGDDLGHLVAEAGRPGGEEVVVLSQKIVSKAEGRLRRLAEVEPGRRARELAETLGRDPALVELVLEESRAVLRAERGVLITETRQGWICANAGIDASNLEPGWVSLLPLDADQSARRIRRQIEGTSNTAPAVVIADSFGRPWRVGQADIAIGCAGIEPLADWRGRRDARGNELSATLIATADELAAAADLSRDKDSDVPGAIVAGLAELISEADGPGAAAIRRPASEDLFR
jgi:coenzyme F420-0:L-glutamate ligase / coenzyme F420-1:gamma-L-glutamate ligase